MINFNWIKFLCYYNFHREFLLTQLGDYKNVILIRFHMFPRIDGGNRISFYLCLLEKRYTTITIMNLIGLYINSFFNFFVILNKTLYERKVISSIVACFCAYNFIGLCRFDRLIFHEFIYCDLPAIVFQLFFLYFFLFLFTFFNIERILLLAVV